MCRNNKREKKECDANDRSNNPKANNNFWNELDLSAMHFSEHV